MLSPHQIRGEGVDQGNFLTIHKMIILSNLRYGEKVYGSASKPVLKKLEPTHNRGIRLTLGVFAVCHNENALCVTGVSTLADMRNLNTTITAYRFISNPNHPIRSFCLNPTKLVEYALRPAAPKPLFARAREYLEKLQIDTRKNERFPQYFRPPWTNIDEHNSRIYTDGSKRNEKVGYAVVLIESTVKRRQFPQNLIYSAEQSAIINAFNSTANYNQKRVITTDSLNTIIAVSDRKRSKNPKTELIRKLIDQASTNITLLWALSHVGIPGNEAADDATQQKKH
jgi:ribonuclease HI